jgi:DNA-binding IclR family transcriptional regulator/nitroimidazol reductase NimA-like FMN-containing flavoprotein (pyridoxamine 5'-phosphate oxidase superfamily)
MNDDQLVSTAERTLRLIELLLTQPEGLTPQELMLQLDVSRSSLFLLLRTLKSLGYVEQAERRGRYRTGPRLEAWRGTPSPAVRDLLTAFYQEAARLALPETLALLVGRHGAPSAPLVLGQAEGSERVRSSFSAGQAYPGPQALLPVLEDAPPQAVRENGYVLAAGEETLELALPVCRDGIHPYGALLLSAPCFRWQQEALLERFLPQMRAAAARLSYQIGAPAYSPYGSLDQPAAPLQPTSPMTGDEMDAFLEGPWTARLACVRPNGEPHVIPVWQEWDGQHFYVLAWKGSQWAEYLFKNPSVSLTVDEPWAPLRRVAVRGRAERVEPGQGMQIGALLQRSAKRYLGRPLDESSAPIDCAFRITPDYLRGWKGVSAGMARG